MAEATFADVFAQVESELGWINVSGVQETGGLPPMIRKLRRMGKKDPELTQEEAKTKDAIQKQILSIAVPKQVVITDLRDALDLLSKHSALESDDIVQDLRAGKLEPLATFLKVLDDLDNVLTPLAVAAQEEEQVDVYTLLYALEEWKRLQGWVDGWDEYKGSVIVDYYVDMELDLHGERLCMIRQQILALASNYAINEDILQWLQSETSRFVERKDVDLAILGNFNLYRSLSQQVITELWTHAMSSRLGEHDMTIFSRAADCLIYDCSCEVPVNDGYLDIALSVYAYLKTEGIHMEDEGFYFSLTECWTEEQQAKVAAVRKQFQP